MKYVIIGLLVSLGWHFAKVIYEIAEELLFVRLHRAKWYQFIAGKKPKEIESKPGDIKEVKNQIGFM